MTINSHLELRKQIDGWKTGRSTSCAIYVEKAASHVEVEIRKVLEEYSVSEFDNNEVPQLARENLVVSLRKLDVSTFRNFISETFSYLPFGTEYLVRLLLSKEDLASSSDLMKRLFHENPEFVIRHAGSEWDLGPFLWIRVGRKLPTAFLFIGESETGKTSASSIFEEAANIKVIHGDDLLLQIAQGQLRTSERLQDISLIGYCANDWWLSVELLIQEDLYIDFFQLVVSLVGRSNFIFDMFIPEEHRETIIYRFMALGYKVINCTPLNN